MYDGFAFGGFNYFVPHCFDRNRVCEFCGGDELSIKDSGRDRILNDSRFALLNVAVGTPHGAQFCYAGWVRAGQIYLTVYGSYKNGKTLADIFGTISSKPDRSNP